MCDRCAIDMALYGAPAAGFRCSDVSEELLAEEANGIARFPNRAKKKPEAEEPRHADAVNTKRGS